MILTPVEQAPYVHTNLVDYGDITVREEVWDIDGLLKAQQTKSRPIIEKEVISKLLSAIEEHGLEKVLALRDRKRKPFNLVDLSNPLEVRGKGRGV